MATNKSLPFKVTSDADCTITEIADGYSIEVAGNTVIETTSGGTITLSLPSTSTKQVSL